MRFCFAQKEFVDLTISPEKTAIIGSDFQLTWNEFSKKVDEFCEFLIENQFDELANPVIVYGHKSANMIVVIYALMKLEIPYIPVDIIYPHDRVVKITDISKSELAINTTDNALNIAGLSEVSVSHDAIVLQTKNTRTQRVEKGIDPIVYIIFTSGSTGAPKGVQISTEAVQSFTKWMSNDFGFNSDDVFVNSALLSFDLSVFELMTFGTLGATLLLNSKSTCSDHNALLNRVEKYKGTVWVSTPSSMLIYSRLKGELRMNSIHSFLFCGEVLPHDLAQKLISNYGHTKVINTYGPTEATVATTLIEITQEVLDKYNPLPVGKSKNGSQLALDEDEIVIIGPNVSIGYLDNEELNRKKFKVIEGQRAFKTGDKGHFVDDFLFFNGRDDDLVKLHGYRIELNEINSAINSLEYVVFSECIPLRRNGDVKKIVTVVQLSPNHSIDAKILKDDIAKLLPVYMIPADVLFVDEFPLNQNGKVNKKLLLETYMNRNKS